MSTTDNNDTPERAPEAPIVDEAEDMGDALEVLAVTSHENGYDVTLAIPMEVSDARFQQLMARFCFTERALRATKRGKPVPMAQLTRTEEDEAP